MAVWKTKGVRPQTAPTKTPAKRLGVRPRPGAGVPARPTMERVSAAGAAARTRTGVENLAEYGRLDGVEARTRYQKAIVLRELARVERYRDELRFGSFEELLEAHELVTRMTTTKWFKVIGAFTEDEVVALGGFEKAYYAMKALEIERPGAEPQQLLRPNAKVMGKPVQGMSGRYLRAAVKGGGGARCRGSRTPRRGCRKKS